MAAPDQPIIGGVHSEIRAQSSGWMPQSADGAVAGTTGQSKRLEAVRVSVTGDNSGESSSVWYRVHSQTYGWLGWAHDGADAGTTGLARRAEAIDVQVLPQGQVPRGYDTSKASATSQSAAAANTAGAAPDAHGGAGTQRVGNEQEAATRPDAAAQVGPVQNVQDAPKEAAKNPNNPYK